MINFDQQQFNQIQAVPQDHQQSFDQFQAQLMAPGPNDITPEMLNQFMEFQKQKQMTDTDDFCSPEVESAPKRKRSAAPKRDKHGIKGQYGKRRRVTPGSMGARRSQGSRE